MAVPSMFVWVPKTAGTSVWDWLCSADEDREELGPQVYRFRNLDAISLGHWLPRLAVRRGIVSRGEFERRQVFAFVRNPWDRIVSMWHYFRHRGASSFKEFVEETVRFPMRFTHAKKYRQVAFGFPQASWLQWAGGNWVSATVGRFEDLDGAWRTACERLEWPYRTLGHHNRTETRRHYADYYTPRTRRLVADHEAGVIERFGYQFS